MRGWVSETGGPSQKLGANPLYPLRDSRSDAAGFFSCPILSLGCQGVSEAIRRVGER